MTVTARRSIGMPWPPAELTLSLQPWHTSLRPISGLLSLDRGLYDLDSLVVAA